MNVVECPASAIARASGNLQRHVTTTTPTTPTTIYSQARPTVQPCCPTSSSSVVPSTVTTRRPRLCESGAENGSHPARGADAVRKYICATAPQIRTLHAALHLLHRARNFNVECRFHPREHVNRRRFDSNMAQEGKLDSLADCPICMTSEEPIWRILPCGHSLCAGCLARIAAKTPGRVVCPNDRVAHAVRATADLPRDMQHDEVVKLAAVIRSMAAGDGKATATIAQAGACAGRRCA